MDFSFNVNVVLREKITVITNKDLLYSSSSSSHYNNNARNNLKHESSQNLSKIIDALGTGSAKAQNLKGAITSSFKLKSSDDHLYILKDADGNKGLGCVVGMIRTGKKRLFLSDVFGNQNECVPLCVLDFYVHESKQRSGYGRVLFEFMINEENIAPNQLAIDRPSPKFVNFLKKHYKLETPLNQINKFVIFESFFLDDKAIGLVDNNRRRSAPVFRNKLLEKHTQQASRNVSSANSTKSRTDVSSALGDLADVKPVVRAGYAKNESNGQLSPLLGMRNNTRPGASHSQRRHGDVNSSFSGIGSYSRHTTSRKVPSLPLSPLVKNSRKPHAESRNLLRDQHHTEMHGRNSNLNQQITSLDNPFSATQISSSSSDASYTLGLVDHLSRPPTLGTSWNVFGVPGSNVNTSNPYGRMRNSSRK